MSETSRKLRGLVRRGLNVRLAREMDAAEPFVDCQVDALFSATPEQLAAINATYACWSAHR